MKNWFVISLLGLYGLTLLQAYVPHANYWMNRDYIASVLCENIDKPELDCNGKCHLVKEINKDANSDEAEVESLIQLMVEFPNTAEVLPRFVFSTLDIDLTNLGSMNIRLGYLQGIFHPPR